MHAKKAPATSSYDFLTQSLEGCDDDVLLDAGESPDDEEPEEEVLDLTLEV